MRKALTEEEILRILEECSDVEDLDDPVERSTGDFSRLFKVGWHPT